MDKFWSFTNNADGTAELKIYGDIVSRKTEWNKDTGVNLRDFSDELEKLGNVKAITVRINSGGGDVFTAQAMGALLKEHKAEITARIDGLCASAATIIACQCDRVIASAGSTYMIHPVKALLWDYYDAAALRKEAESLDTVSDGILLLYAAKTGKTREEMEKAMAVETWYTAAQAKEAGFVDEVAGESNETTAENRGGRVFINGVNTGFAPDDLPAFIRETVVDCKESEDMERIETVEALAAAYPDLVNQIAENAAQAERKRIREIEDMTIPGCEALAADAKFEKTMSAEDFAKAVVKNAKAQGAHYLEGLKDDAGASGANGVNNDAPADISAEDAFITDIYTVNGKERKVK